MKKNTAPETEEKTAGQPVSPEIRGEECSDRSAGVQYRQSDRKRMLSVGVLAVCTALAAAASYSLHIDPPMVNVAGAFAVIITVLILMRFVKIPDGLFYTGLVFIFFASPMGSVIDLYRLWAPYDKIVHFASGLLLAAAGYALCLWLYEKISIEALQMWKKRDSKPVLSILILFAFLTASGGAGIWEIFEFTADKIAGGGMQRGMVDTLTDMIAGNLGGIAYCAYMLINNIHKTSR